VPLAAPLRISVVLITGLPGVGVGEPSRQAGHIAPGGSRVDTPGTITPGYWDARDGRRAGDESSRPAGRRVATCADACRHPREPQPGSRSAIPCGTRPGASAPPTRRSPWTGQAVVAANAEQALAADEERASRPALASRLLFAQRSSAEGASAKAGRSRPPGASPACAPPTLRPAIRRSSTSHDDGRLIAVGNRSR
jgi:hypothetical protein